MHIEERKMTSSDKQLDELITQLDKEIKPQRDLWAGIEQAINTLPQEEDVSSAREVKWSVKEWSKLAAMFAPVALMTGIWLGQVGQSQSDVQEPDWLTPVSASFELQKQQLLQRVSSNAVLSPNWRESLKELEKAEKSLKQALIHQPEDAALMKMLTQVHQQQLMLIKKAHQPKFSQI